MKSMLAAGLILFACSCTAQEQQSEKNEVVFRSVRLVSMENDQVKPDQDVAVKDGKIIYVGSSKKYKPGKNAVIVDGKGMYLMPGLAEMHAHVPPVDEIEPMKDVAKLFAAYGITTIRGMLGHPKHIELREDLQNGTIFGPRFYTSGPSFSGSSVQSPEQAREKVREQKNTGYDFLKIHPGLSPEEYQAMAQTADEVKIPFAGHVPFDVGVWTAIEARQQTIDHMDAFVEGLIPDRGNLKESEAGLFGMYVADRADTSRIPALMEGLKKNNVWVIPTQALADRWFTPTRSAESFAADPEMKYLSKKTVDNWVNAKKELKADERYDSASLIRYNDLRRKLIKACNDYEVGLLLGCDAPQVFNVPGISTHHELEYLVQAGLTPYEAIKTGTVNVGRFYNEPDKLGIIKEGAYSDLILLRGNPLENISNTKKIEGVMLGKHWMPRKTLDDMLKKLEKW